MELSTKERYWMCFLTQDSSNAIPKGITSNIKGFAKVGVPKDWSKCHLILNVPKS